MQFCTFLSRSDFTKNNSHITCIVIVKAMFSFLIYCFIKHMQPLNVKISTVKPNLALHFAMMKNCPLSLKKLAIQYTRFWIYVVCLITLFLIFIILLQKTGSESTSIVEFGLILLKKMLQALNVSVQSELPFALRLKTHGP